MRRLDADRLRKAKKKRPGESAAAHRRRLEKIEADIDAARARRRGGDPPAEPAAVAVSTPVELPAASSLPSPRVTERLAAWQQKATRLQQAIVADYESRTAKDAAPEFSSLVDYEITGGEGVRSRLGHDAEPPREAAIAPPSAPLATEPRGNDAQSAEIEGVCTTLELPKSAASNSAKSPKVQRGSETAVGGKGETPLKGGSPFSDDQPPTRPVGAERTVATESSETKKTNDPAPPPPEPQPPGAPAAAPASVSRETSGRPVSRRVSRPLPSYLQAAEMVLLVTWLTHARAAGARGPLVFRFGDAERLALESCLCRLGPLAVPPRRKALAGFNVHCTMPPRGPGDTALAEAMNDFSERVAGAIAEGARGRSAIDLLERSLDFDVRRGKRFLGIQDATFIVRRFEQAVLKEVAAGTFAILDTPLSAPSPLPHTGS